MVTRAIQEFLRTGNVEYTVFAHPPAFTAEGEAVVAGVPERDWAKVVICFVDGEPVEAVVAADRVVDLQELMVLAEGTAVRVAHEDELDWLFPECEAGAMPPFGPLYKQRVFVDADLAVEKYIVFNAGTHRDAVRMRYEDFARLARPIVGRFAVRPH
jgi:Ala-tRNA(Pro) deacylase